MEKEPDTENVAYIDECPHLAEKVRLRRMGQLTLFSSDMGNTTLILFETDYDPAPPDQPA